MQTIVLGFAALGHGFAILVGDTDLCVGGLISLTTVISASLMAHPGIGVPGTVLIVLSIGVLVGVINGYLAVKIKIDAMVTTFSTNAVLMGIALYVMPAPGGSVPLGFMRAAGYSIVGVPVIFILLILCLILSLYILNRSVLGFHIRAVGGDPASAYSSGISVIRTKIAAHVITGVFAVAAGLFMAARMGSGDPLSGTPFSLDSMTAVIAGGAIFSTGIGEATGMLTAALLITALGNIMNHIGVSTYWQYVFKGLLLMSAVAAASLRGKTVWRKGI
jgi:ribose transport system permease protein